MGLMFLIVKVPEKETQRMKGSLTKSSKFHSHCKEPVVACG